LAVGFNSEKEKEAHRRSKFLIMPSLETPIMDTLKKSTLDL
jgi:hypothetical protein